VDDATLLLAYFQSTLQGLFPNSPVVQTKRAARDGKQRQGGQIAGLNLQSGQFVVSCYDGDVVDTTPTFENMSRRYPIVAEYIKIVMNAATVTGRGSAPSDVLEDPDVRDTRTEILTNFFLPTTTEVPNLFDVRVKPGATYDVVADNKTIIVSPITFFCACMNPRPGA
jgi:hypothetical protein